MSLYERVADLPLVVEESDRARNERDTSSGFLRKSTTITLTGEGAAGRGEDVTYDGEDHDALADVPAFVGEDGIVPGSYTFDEFSAAVDDLDLFPTKPPEREASPHYRRWAVESAGLDLALRQAGRSLGDVLGRTYDPVRFVVSTRLDGDAARLERLREHDPDAEFKLDPTEEWDDDLIAAVQTVGGVRVLDFKAFYEGTDVDSDPSPALYERLVAAFPDAVIEDAAVDDGSRAVLESVVDRLAWDYPITGVESVEALPFEPRWLNVKPSRFGTVEALFDTVDWAIERDVSLYGGGQFELDVGRPQIQSLAGLLYPEGPNDVAPGGYNLPEPPADLPTSPLAAPDEPVGFGYATDR